MVELLPGTKPKLSEEQLKQSFYDGMPSAWKEKFVSGGSNYDTMNLPELTQYFRTQEKLSKQRQQQNDGVKVEKPSAKRKANGRGNGEQPTPKKNKQGKKKEKRSLTDDSPCPIHGKGHTWGECRARERKPQNQSNRNDKGKKKAESFLTETTIVPSDDAGMSLPDCFVVDTMVQLDDHLTSELIASFRQDIESEDTTVFEAFITAAEDSHAIGIHNTIGKGHDESSRTNVPKTNLLPIGIMTVATINSCKVTRPLKVLFDSGSMLTLVHPRVVPAETVPHVMRQPVSLYTVSGPVTLTQGVTLETLRFPELSPTRSYINVVEAVVYQHTRDYDVILGIDVMVAAGIDVHPSTNHQMGGTNSSLAYQGVLVGPSI